MTDNNVDAHLPIGKDKSIELIEKNHKYYEVDSKENSTVQESDLNASDIKITHSEEKPSSK